MPNAPIILIVGPTATGKTGLSIQLAETLNAEIISADSQLVYKFLNIGTAKPTNEERQQILHHGIDLVEPTTQYSAGHYADALLPVFEHLVMKNKPVIITGGTGFYIQSLLQPQRLQKIPPNLELRQTLEAAAKNKPDDWLHKQLYHQDPVRAQQLHPKDQRRVIRALEIIQALGTPVPETPTEYFYPVTAIGLAYENKQNQWQNINTRLQSMLAAGFMDEAIAIYKQYGNCPALQTAHGYSNLIDVYEGRCTLADAIEATQVMIRQYSKRQMTWFRKVPNIQWYASDTTSQAKIVGTVLEQIQ